MGLQASGHECDRFRAVGLECPFRRFREDDDDEEEPEERDAHEIPLALPGRAARERELNNITTLAVAPKELREALERMAAFQRMGELQSIPNFTRQPAIRGLPKIPDFPLSGRGHPEIISILAAIAISRGLAMLRARGFPTNSLGVRLSERLAAKGLRKVSEISKRGSVRQTGRGRGGFNVNAARELRGLLFGFGQRKRRRGGLADPGVGDLSTHVDL